MIKTAKVIAAVWGTRDIFHQDDFEEKDESNKGYLVELML